LDFLRRTSSGPAVFTVKDVKLGRQTSVIHVSLSQGSREEVVGFITNSNMHSETGLTLDTKYKLEPPSPAVNLVALKENRDELWGRQGDMPFASFRKAGQKVYFHFPKTGQPTKAIADEWLCFRNGEKFTNASLGFFCDMFPMPVEAFFTDKNIYDVTTPKEFKTRAAKFWYPTLLLNLDIKKPLPEEGVEWLFGRVLAKQIKNGRTDLEVIICDEMGEVVALSHHVTLILPAERNTASRRKEESKI
jgi:hypothetical protein